MKSVINLFLLATFGIENEQREKLKSEGGGVTPLGRCQQEPRSHDPAVVGDINTYLLYLGLQLVNLTLLPR